MIDDTGCVEKEFSVLRHPDDLGSALEPFSRALKKVGLEAGPMSEFLAAGLKR